MRVPIAAITLGTALLLALPFASASADMQESFYIAEPPPDPAFDGAIRLCRSAFSGPILSSRAYIERQSPELVALFSECLRDITSPTFANECEVIAANAQVDLVMFLEMQRTSTSVVFGARAWSPARHGTVWSDQEVVPNDIDFEAESLTICRSLAGSFLRSQGHAAPAPTRSRSASAQEPEPEPTPAPASVPAPAPASVPAPTPAPAQVAQGSGAPSTFEDITVAPGFLPDPRVVTGRSGGPVDARQYGSTSHGPCVGNIATAPDHYLILERPFNYLRVEARSPGDLTLVIEGPDGRRCNDDFEGLNPGIEGAWPAGRYAVYVGTFDTNHQQYQLSVTEYRRP